MSVASTSRIRQFTSSSASCFSRVDVARRNPRERRGTVCYNLRDELQATVTWLVERRLFSKEFGKVFSRWAKLQVWCGLGQALPMPVTFESMTLRLYGVPNQPLLLSIHQSENSPVYTTVIHDSHGHFLLLIFIYSKQYWQNILVVFQI